ncbi:unnamed protein product [Prunus brigantina]
MYSVHILTRFMHDPRKPHLDAAMRVLRNLKSTPRQGLFFPAGNEMKLTKYYDLDWAGCPTTRSTYPYNVHCHRHQARWHRSQSLRFNVLGHLSPLDAVDTEFASIGGHNLFLFFSLALLSFIRSSWIVDMPRLRLRKRSRTNMKFHHPLLPPIQG